MGPQLGQGQMRAGDAVQPDLGFGDDVIHDHVDHGAGSKGQRVRQDGLGQNHGEGPKEPRHGLHHATQLPVPTDRTETVPPRGSGRHSTRSGCACDSDKRRQLFHIVSERGGSAAQRPCFPSPLPLPPPAPSYSYSRVPLPRVFF